MQHDEVMVVDVLSYKLLSLHGNIGDAHFGGKAIAIAQWDRTHHAAIQLLQDHMRTSKVNSVDLRLITLVDVEEFVERPRNQATVAVKH